MNIVIVLLFIPFMIFSQDSIVKKNGEYFISKVIEISKESIAFKKTTNINGPTYTLPITDISRITFENGTQEFFDSNSENTKMSLAEIKVFLKENIDRYCYDGGTGKWLVIAEFEGDYLRLYWKAKATDLKVRKLDLYDFSKKCIFQKLSRRNKDVAYINVFIPKLIKKSKNIWSNKDKLVLEVHGHDKAELIINAMKRYNALLYKE